MNDHFKISLLNNAYSFLNEALSKALTAERDTHNWKFAALNLVQAIELALKERLKQEHQFFIYQNVDKPKNTVNLMIALERLIKIAKIKFSEADIDAIKKAADLRNNIVHYEFNFNPKEVKLVFAKLLGFLSQFHKKHLKTGLEEIISDELWHEALTIFEFAEELYDRAKKRFEEEKIDDLWIWICRVCGQESFVIQDGINTCYVCGYQTEVIQCPLCEELIYDSDGYELEKQDRSSTDLVCKNCYERVIREEEYYYHEMMDHFYNK